MRLRVFDAPNMQTAMARMREGPGPDAVIVASQETAEGVRLTAAAEGPRAAVDDLLRPRPDDAGLARLAAALAFHGTPAALVQRLLGTASATGEPAVQLAGALQASLRFLPPLERGTAPILLAGPAGAGKTTVAARLAARLLLAGQEVSVVAADRDRSGGLAQLAELLAPMGLQPTPIHDAPELVRLLRGAGGRRIIVDLPAVDPFRGQDLARLADLAGIGGQPATVVMPAGLEPGDCAEMAQNLVALGCRHMIVTRLDLARRLGGILAAADAGLAVAEASTSPLIGRSLVPLEPAGFARLMLANAEPKPDASRTSDTAARRNAP